MLVYVEQDKKKISELKKIPKWYILNGNEGLQIVYNQIFQCCERIEGMSETVKVWILPSTEINKSFHKLKISEPEMSRVDSNKKYAREFQL